MHPIGGSSGIGLATVELLLELGANVVVGDQQPIPISHDSLTFLETNVLSWPSLLALFNKAVELHGQVDHVFANAGIGGFRADYFSSSFDEATGELLEPSNLTYDVNLKAVINTAYLGMHHMRQQQQRTSTGGGGGGGSVVLTASASSFQRFRNVDYATAKHGVVGFMRGLVPELQAQNLPIRVNCIAPTFTQTGLVSRDDFKAIGLEHLLQEPTTVAQSTAILMADASRQGQVVYSAGGRLYEIEESKLLPLVADIVGKYSEDPVGFVFLFGFFFGALPPPPPIVTSLLCARDCTVCFIHSFEIPGFFALEIVQCNLVCFVVDITGKLTNVLTDAGGTDELQERAASSGGRQKGG